ncbi:fructoselysine 6-kinase [Flavonifractor sp. HCP28S3_F3]|uniref:fructoselysine 6-kinase n=1 Tax=Flavonifractor sp. HCP28S3_F3 TaxID=3438939 RepID=UPI003F8A4932
MDVYTASGQAFPGGNPVNVAVYNVRLGGTAAYIGAVGTDEYGSLMRQAIADKGVDVSHVHTLPGKTAVTMVELRNGERILGDYDEGVLADFCLSETDVDFLAGFDLMHTALWGGLENELPRLRRRGLLISFDFATAQNGPVLEAALPYTNYAFFAREEDSPGLRDFLRQVHAKGPELVVATLGDQGSLAYDGQRFYQGGIVPVKVVDTMGAGDSYIAGFLSALHGGGSIPEAMQAGAANASVTLSYQGAW